MPLYRSLRVQLLAIIVCAMVLVFGAAEYAEMRLSGRALQEDLEQRIWIILKIAGRLWESGDHEGLRTQLAAVQQVRRQVVAIDLFEIEGVPRWLATTRKDAGPAESVLDKEALGRLMKGESFKSDLPARQGTVPWRLAVPLEAGGKVVAAAQVEVWPAQERKLSRKVHGAHAGIIALTLVLTSLWLAWFLNRRVARPVRTLYAAMEQVKGGNLAARVQLESNDEFGVLAGELNRMLDQIAELTTGLETKVEEATRGIARKSTELRLLNDKLHRAQLEAARRAPLAAVGQMASSIAHELGTPLNSILGYTQLLLRKEATPEQREKLTVIESQIRRMVETIQHVLDRTRTQAVARAPVDVRSLVEDSLALVSQRIAETELRVTTEIPSDLPPVEGDAIGLRQILVNLLTNAIDAVGQNGAVAIRATVVPGNNGKANRLDLAVEDSGPGLSPEGLERMFEPFYTTKAPGVGTGLGLAIVTQIVGEHGGKVLAESEPGRGTTVRVQIPLET